MVEQYSPVWIADYPGRDYLCVLDDVELPDGISVHADYAEDGSIEGVLAKDSEGGTVHSCGTLEE